MKNVRVDYVQMEALPGVDLDESIRQAAIYCLENDVAVKLSHNEKKWHFTPVSIIINIRHSQKEVNHVNN